MCVYVVCLVNVQAEQSELSRNSWSSKISLESANGCKIYSTLACAASGSVKNRKKKRKKLALSRKEPWSGCSSVYDVVLVCTRSCVTWAGIHCCSWWSLQWSAPLASACTSWTDRGNRRSGPGPRQRADARKEKNLAAIFKHDILPQHISKDGGPKTCVKTLVEFLLGAVRGQSGSVGFRQGLSM